MTPRRLGLLFGLAAIAAFGPRFVLAQSEKFQENQSVYQSEGRNPVMFAVTCATATWTLVIASDTISRSTFIETPGTNNQVVCLSFSSAPANPSQCVATQPGVILPQGSSLTDYTHAAWYCAASSGTTSQNIVGYRTRDKGDYGRISDPSRQ